MPSVQNQSDRDSNGASDRSVRGKGHGEAIEKCKAMCPLSQAHLGSLIHVLFFWLERRMPSDLNQTIYSNEMVSKSRSDALCGTLI